MRKARTIGTLVVLGIGAAGISMLQVGSTPAHCDSKGGPVIMEAQAALERGDVTPTLKWVKMEDEPEIRTAFAKAVAVRGNGAEAKELADQYFLETLVRLHRSGEGAPYTGITDEPVEPIVAMADKALTDGSAEDMIANLGDHLSDAIRAKFSAVVEARRNKERSVEDGRKFVEAYVTYVHYVEGINSAIVSTGAHHDESEPGTAGHED
jgi:hypothetical protein